MKYLGKNGIDEMVTAFHLRAKQLEKGLEEIGFQIVNDVVFNQVLVASDNDEKTKQIIDKITILASLFFYLSYKHTANVV